MHLTNLTIRNLRCIENLELEADRKLNMLLGDNAQGKSTVLEAIFMLSSSKSFRTSKDRELIRLEERGSYIGCTVHRDNRNPVKVELALVKNQPKLLKIDGVKKQRISDLFGEINCVIFSSEDIAALKGEPKTRRHYLNLDISQIYPSYASSYGEYKKVLLQRNSLLEGMKNNPATYNSDILDIYDERTAALGAELIHKRLEYTKKLFTYAGEYYKSITDNERAEFRYQSSVKFQKGDREEIQKAMINQLREKRETDLAYHTTGCGPHRDDITVTVDSVPVKIYGSSGQQRCCSLAMKLAQIYLTYDITGEYPIVLLDDFTSELDKSRQSAALAAAENNCQCFITATHIHKERGKVFSMEKGRLI